MATARRALTRARSQHRSLRPFSFALVAVTALLAAVAGPMAPSNALPQLTIAQVEARVHALNEQAEKITESYNLARERLTALKRQQRISAHRLAAEQRRLARVQKTISATADATYRTGGFGQYVLGAATDPQSFLDQAMLLDALSRTQAQQFASAGAANRAVEGAKARYDAQAVQVRQQLSRISSQKSHIESLLAQARDLLSSLRADQRARMAAAAAAERAQQTAMRGSYNGPASGQAAVAIRFAYNQLGKPYVYGASGPNSYDCSGLTMAAWNAAGVYLPHNAAAQQSATRAVSSPQPGDLVFFGYPASHVGLYIGNGRMIAAPHTGDVVKIQAVYGGVSGYGRP